MSVLLICNDAQEVTRLSSALQQANVEFHVVQSVDEALARWETEPADMIIVALRDSVPLTVAQRIRTVIAAPLLFIIDSFPEDEQIALVEVGRAFVVMRPYSLRVLARQIALLLQPPDPPPRTAPEVLQHGAVVLNLSERTVRVGERPFQPLSRLEFTLLAALMRHAGQVLPAETLIEQVWDYEEGDKSMLQNLVWRLRSELEPDPRQPRYVLTVGEVGYRFRGE